MRTAMLSLMALSLAGCEATEDFEPHRKVLRDRLRDPASAEFRNEKIRTIWSEDGSRKKIYCAELNAANAFGGKTGFKPATVIIEAIDKSPDTYGVSKSIWSPGKSFIDDVMSPGYYLDCQRADTQRKNDEVFVAIPMLGGAWDEEYRARTDRENPVISMDEAPTS